MEVAATPKYAISLLPAESVSSLTSGLKVRSETQFDELVLTVEKSDYRTLCERLFAAGFDFPSSMTGVDMEWGLGVVLHVQQLESKRKVAVRTYLPYDAPTLPTVLRGLPSERVRYRNALGATILLLTFLIWMCAFGLSVWVSGLVAKLALTTLTGAAIGVAFVIGHDACHGALTSNARFNRWGAWLAFLPALHPPTSWDWGHNRMHHSWTNLRGRDYVYAPLTVVDWAALTSFQRVLRRVYYTLPGIGLFYFIDIWWKHVVWLDRDELVQLRSRRAHTAELIALSTFLIALCALVWNFGAWQSGGVEPRISELVLCLVWPFYVWNWIMAFVTIQHHTHPRTRWFDRESEWSFFQAQVGGTVHMKFPRIVELGFANIFEHTAHHVDKRTPLYNLPMVQRYLEKNYGDTVIVQQASLTHLRDVLKRCRLYDYRQCRWMDFDGRYTT